MLKASSCYIRLLEQRDGILAVGLVSHNEECRWWCGLEVDSANLVGLVAGELMAGLHQE